MPKYFEIKIPEEATLGKLAQQYGTSVQGILALNPYIKDPNVIKAGASLKLPKLTGVVAPFDYQRDLSAGIKRLYFGDYGKEWARERLLKELEIKFPQVDVAIDIYTRIPDGWQIKPSPISITTVEKIEKEESWFDTISSFVSKEIKQPFQEQVGKAAFSLFKTFSEILTPKEVLSKAKAEAKKFIFEPIDFAVKEKLGPVFRSVKDSYYDLQDVVIRERKKVPALEEIVKDLLREQVQSSIKDFVIPLQKKASSFLEPVLERVARLPKVPSIKEISSEIFRNAISPILIRIPDLKLPEVKLPIIKEVGPKVSAVVKFVFTPLPFLIPEVIPKPTFKTLENLKSGFFVVSQAWKNRKQKNLEVPLSIPGNLSSDLLNKAVDPLEQMRGDVSYWERGIQGDIEDINDAFGRLFGIQIPVISLKEDPETGEIMFDSAKLEEIMKNAEEDPDFLGKKFEEAMKDKLKTYIAVSEDLLLKEFGRRTLENYSLTTQVSGYWKETAEDLFEHLKDPKNLTTEGVKMFKQILEKNFGTAPELEALSLTLKSYDQFVIDNKSLVDQYQVYQRELSSWQTEYNSLMTDETQLLFEKFERWPELSQDEQIEVSDFYETNKDKVDRLLQLHELIYNAQIFIKTQKANEFIDLANQVDEGMNKVFALLAPSAIEGLEQIARDSTIPTTEPLKILKKISENQKWIRDNADELKRKSLEAEEAEKNMTRELFAMNSTLENFMAPDSKSPTSFTNLMNSLQKNMLMYQKSYLEQTEAATIQKDNEINTRYLDALETNFLKILGDPELRGRAFQDFGEGIAELPIIKQWNIYFEKVIIRWVMPAIQVKVLEDIKAFQEIGIPDFVGEHIMPVLNKLLLVSYKAKVLDPEKVRENAKAITSFLQMLNVPQEENIPSFLVDPKGYINSFKERIEYFQKNENYDILTFEIPVNLKDLIPEKRALTVDGILAINPHIKPEDSERVPANIPIVIPKFDPAPSIWKFLTPEGRAKVAAEHPFFYGIVEGFGPLMFDPLMYPVVYGRILMLSGSIGTKVLGLKPAIRVAESLKMTKAAQTLGEIGYFNTQLFKFLWPTSIPTTEWAAARGPKILGKMPLYGVPTLVSAKQAVLSFSLVKSLPLKYQNAVYKINDYLNGNLSRAVTLTEVNAAIRSVARKDPRLTKKIAQEWEDWVIGVIVKPSDRVAKVLNKLGLPSSELWRLLVAEPKTKEVIEIFIRRIDEAHEGTKFRSRIYNKLYQKASYKAKNYFDEFYDLKPLKKGQYSAPGKILKRDETEVEAIRRIEAHWAEPERVSAKDLAQGKILVSNWRNETASWAFLEKLTVSRIKIPGQFEWKEAVTAKQKRMLKGERSILIADKNKRIYIYDKDKFYAGTGEILQDFLSKNLSGPRIENLKDIQIYAGGNVLLEEKLVPTGALTKVGKPAMEKVTIRQVKKLPTTAADSMITDFWDPKKGIYYQWSKENQRWYQNFLKDKRLVQDKVIEIPVSVTYHKYNPRDKTWTIISDIGEEFKYVKPSQEKVPWIGKEEELIKKTVLDNHTLEYVKEATALDWYRWNNPDMFWDFRAKLNRIPERKLTALQELQKFIVNLPDAQRTTSYQRLLLLSDVFNTAQKAEIWSRIKELQIITARHYKETLIKGQLAILEKRGVSVGEILDKKRELVRVKQEFEFRESGANREFNLLNQNTGLGLETIEVKNALSVKFIYVPTETKQGDALLIYLREYAQKPLTESYLKLLAELKPADATVSIKVLKQLEEDLKIPLKNLRALGTLPTDSVVIPKSLRDSIREYSKKGWIMKIADVTRRDKALIRFMNKEKISYQKIDVKPIQEGKFLKAEEIVDHIKNLGIEGQLNPVGIFTNEGLIKILSKKLYRPKVRVPKGPKEIYSRTPEDELKIKIASAQEYRYNQTMKSYYQRLDEYRILLTEEMRKTDYGRMLLKKIDALIVKRRREITLPEKAMDVKGVQILETDIRRVERGVWEDFIQTFDNRASFVRDSLGVSGFNPVIKDGRLLGLFPITDFKEHRLVQEILVRGTVGKPLGSWTPEITNRLIKKVPLMVSFDGLRFIDDFAIAFQLDRFGSIDDFTRYLKKLKASGFEKAGLKEVDEFLADLIVGKTDLLPEELSTIELILGGDPLRSDLIFRIDRAIIEAQQVIKNRLVFLKVPPGKRIVDGILIAKTSEISHLESLRRLIPDWRIAQRSGIRLTPNELWEASMRNFSPQIEEKLKKIGIAIKEARARSLFERGIPENLQEFTYAFPELRKSLPEVVVRGKSSEFLGREIIARDFLDKKILMPQVLDYSLPKDLNTSKIWTQLNTFEGQGVKIVIDSSRTGILLKLPFTKRDWKFKIIRIKELTPDELSYLSVKGSLATETEIIGMQKLRDLFWDNKKLAVVGEGEFPYLIKDSFYSRYLTPAEKDYLDAGWDIFRRLLKLSKTPGYKGEVYLFAKGDPFRMKLPDGTVVDLKFSVPIPREFMVLKRRPVVEARSALKEAENAWWNAEWIDKKIITQDPFREGGILIIGGDSAFLEATFLKNLNEIIAKKNPIFLPSIRTRGEFAIEELLKKKKILFTSLDVEKNYNALLQGADGSLPAFVLNLGKPAGKWRPALFKNLELQGRKYLGMELMKKTYINQLMKVMRKSIKEIDSRVPSFIRDEILKKRIPSEKALADWVRYYRRKDLKAQWMDQKVKLTAEYKKDLIKSGKLLKNRDLTSYELKQIDRQVDEIETILTGLDKHVFKWGKLNPVTGKWEQKVGVIEKFQKFLSDKLKIEYIFEDGSYGIMRLPTDRSMMRVTRAVLQGIEKLAWELPTAVDKILRRPFQLVYGFWINSILFFRASWHIWNSMDDGFRFAMKSKNINDFFKMQVTFASGTGKYLRKAFGDQAKLFLEMTGFYLWGNKLALKTSTFMGGKLGALSNEILRTLRAGKFKTFNLEDYFRTKRQGIWYFIDEKTGRNLMTDVFGMKRGDRAFRRTRAGEILKPDDVETMSASGLATALDDPVQRRWVIDSLGETTYFERVYKRLAILPADLKIYSGAMEEMRRLIGIHELLFNQAFTIAKANAFIKSALFDYRDLTLAGRFFRTFFPFYTFNIKALQMYLGIMFRYGPGTYYAAKLLLTCWSEVNSELPEYLRFRVPLGNEVYWAPRFSVIEFMTNVLEDPLKSAQQFIDNPLRAPLGLGWNPFMVAGYQAASGKDYWSVSKRYQDFTGWTKWEVDNYMKEEGVKDRDYSILDMPWAIARGFWENLPWAPLMRSLYEADIAFAMREIPIINSKFFRKWATYFGLNIMKYDALSRLRTEYYRLPPRKRSSWLKDLNKENPDLYNIWRQYHAIRGIIDVQNEKDPLKKQGLMIKLQNQTIIDQYYFLEDEAKGTGERWLTKEKERGNPAPTAVMTLHWKGLELTPWRLKSREEYEESILRSQVKELMKRLPSGWTEEKVNRVTIVVGGTGIEVPMSFDKEFLRMTIFDEHGNLRVRSLEEALIIIGPDLIKALDLRKEDIISTAESQWMEYRALEKEAQREKKYEDAVYYHRLATLFAILPSNIDLLSQEEQDKYWKEWRDYFDNNLTDRQRQRYLKSLPEVQRIYLERMEEYINWWKVIIAKLEKKDLDFDYFKTFFTTGEDWYRKLYFYTNADKKLELWYSFAYKFGALLRKADRLFEETGERSSEPMDFFFAPGNKEAREAWDFYQSKFKYPGEPGIIGYLTRWKNIQVVTETNPEKYFPLFYSQPEWFRKRFFSAEKNKRKAIYYPFVAKWVGLIQKDKENWEIKGIRTELAEFWFWTSKNKKARDAYAKDNMITKDKSIIDYLKIWQAIIEITEESPDQYFPEFYSQDEWFKKHFFKNNPNKAVYYPFVRRWTELIKEDQEVFKRTGKRSTKAADYFWAVTKEARIARNLYNKDNPGILDYLKAWGKIISQTEDNPELYYELFYQQSKDFQDRFFKNNPDKAVYYPHLRQWIRLIALDKKNWEEKHKRTSLASQWFWRKEAAKARKLYGKANMITATQSILDYLKLWETVMKETEERPEQFFAIFDEQPGWFKDHYFANHPDRKIYYPFAKELGKQKPEDFATFFWAARYEKERQAWDREKPGFLAYMRFWKQLSSYTEVGNWQEYFNFYFSTANKKYRERHWRNNPLAEERFVAFRKYSLMPSMTWEERRAKREFLKRNPQLLEWWKENLSEEEAEDREKVEHYFELLDNIKAEGSGRNYFLDYRRWKIAAERYLKMNPEVLLFFQKRPRFYTGEKAEIFGLIASFNALIFPEEKRVYLDAHPELAEYFLNSNPPGIRRILKAQQEYFAQAESEKAAYLEKHPELIDWWEVSKLPWSFFFAKDRFRSFENAVGKIDKAFSLYILREWVKAEKARKILPEIYLDPGETDEDDWFRNKVYKLAMKTWIKLIDQNTFMAIYYFRQLPRWIRDQYYSKHPEKRYLSTEPLSRFAEEPLRIWSAMNPELAWAYQQHYKYGKNLPYEIEARVRDIFIKEGVWISRSLWTQKDWQDFWLRRSLALNEVKQFDYQNLPLLRVELDKVIKTFPLRIKPRPFGSRGRVLPRIGVIQPLF